MGKLRHIGKDPRPAGRAGGAGNWTRSVTGPPHPHPPLQTSGLAPASGCWLGAAVPRTSPATTLGGNAAVTRAGAGRLARPRAGPTRRSLPPPPPTDIAECRTPGACANGHCPGRGWGWGWRGARTAAGAWTPTCAARATGPRRAPARAPPLAPSPDPSVAVLAPTAGSGGPASCVQPGAQVSLCMAGPRLLCGAQLLPFIIWGGPGPGACFRWGPQAMALSAAGAGILVPVCSAPRRRVGGVAQGSAMACDSPCPAPAPQASSGPCVAVV